MPFAYLQNQSIKVSNYKCFGAEPQGFEVIRPVNVLVGRNNSGKSALLDIVEYLAGPQALAPHGHAGNAPTLHLTSALTEGALQSAFPRTASGGALPGNHWEYGKQWLGKPFKWRVDATGKEDLDGPIPAFDVQGAQQYIGVINALKEPPLSGRLVRRLSAERDMCPEPGSNSLSITPTGVGATNCVQAFLNRSDLPSGVVEKLVLSDLNEIFWPDARFARIDVQQDANSGSWEIYLHEEGKDGVPLSHTGSGLKTILLVLCFLHILPRIDDTVDLDQRVFCFEELENNLHPALERRLLAFLRGVAETKGCVFFLTTHSPIAIDFFSKDDQAQLLHVVRDGQGATASVARTYIENRGVLDDLDIRASDLLQANCIIWVEGPSDMLYVNRWLALLPGEKLKRGRHYECMFYGGRLLAHLSAVDPDESMSDLVALLSVNKNAILMMDSDRSGDSEKLNKTKLRLRKELQRVGLISWVTAGREVENYLSASAVGAALGISVSRAPAKNRRFVRYLEDIQAGSGEKFGKRKVLFAERACAAMKASDLDRFDLRERLTEVHAAISSWNKIAPLAREA